MSTFGERIYNLRKKNGLTQMKLAKKIGSSKGTIQNYESNTLPKGEYAIKLAQVFNCSIDWLLTGKDPLYKDDTQKKNEEHKKPSNNNIIAIDHCDLVKKFEDQARAKQINENLLLIERQNKQAFRDVDHYIKGIANGLKYSSQEQHSKKIQKDMVDKDPPKNGTTNT